MVNEPAVRGRSIDHMIMPGIGEDDAKGFRSSHAAIYNTFNNHATMREMAAAQAALRAACSTE
jgi:hypothetical protein